MCALVFGCVTPHPPILIPEIGERQTDRVKATTASLVALGQELDSAQPETILLVSPHGPVLHGSMGIFTGNRSSGDFARWGVEGLGFVYDNDMELVKAILQETEGAGIPLRPIADEGYTLDWGVLVPLYFLGRHMEGIRLVPLTYSWRSLSDHLAFGNAIQRAAQRIDRRAAFVASGDLSHRLKPGAPAGFDPMGKVFDHKLVEALKSWDIEAILNMDPDMVARAGECGLRSITILMGALQGLPVGPKVLSYEGPFGVGYLVASFGVGAH